MITQMKMYIKQLSGKKIGIICYSCFVLLFINMWIKSYQKFSLEVEFLILIILTSIQLGLPLIWSLLKYAEIQNKNQKLYKLASWIGGSILFLLISGLIFCYFMAKHYELQASTLSRYLNNAN